MKLFTRVMGSNINYLILIISCFPLTIIARLGRKVDGICVYLLGGLFIWVASINESNFDHQNYINRINDVVSIQSSGLLAQFAISKDPIMPIIVDLVHEFSNNYVIWTIATISAISVLLKVWATDLLPGRRTLFLSLYVIFLAPQFEFEAIRAALAMSFVLFSLTRSRWVTRLFVWILAIFSHASVLIVGLGILHQDKLSFKKVIMMLVGVAVLIGMAALTISRVDVYLNNAGTTNAYFLPVLTVILICFGYAELDDIASVNNQLIFGFIYWSSLISAIFAVCISSFMVTISFRIIAISWVLYMFFFFLKKKSSSNRRGFFYLRSVSFFLLLFVMSFASFKNDAWTILLSGWR